MVRQEISRAMLTASPFLTSFAERDAACARMASGRGEWTTGTGRPVCPLPANAPPRRVRATARHARPADGQRRVIDSRTFSFDFLFDLAIAVRKGRQTAASYAARERADRPFAIAPSARPEHKGLCHKPRGRQPPRVALQQDRDGRFLHRVDRLADRKVDRPGIDAVDRAPGIP